MLTRLGHKLIKAVILVCIIFMFILVQFMVVVGYIGYNIILLLEFIINFYQQERVNNDR